MSNGQSISINKNVRCNLNSGLKCLNSDQISGQCEDFKIRYLCKCGMFSLAIFKLLVASYLKDSQNRVPNTKLLLFFYILSAFENNCHLLKLVSLQDKNKDFFGGRFLSKKMKFFFIKFTHFQITISVDLYYKMWY